MDEGRRTNWNYIPEPNSSNSAKEGGGNEDGLGDTCFSHNKQYPHEPSNLDTPSHHAPVPPTLNPVPSESTPMPPGDLSPSPASRIETLNPSLPS